MRGCNKIWKKSSGVFIDFAEVTVEGIKDVQFSLFCFKTKKKKLQEQKFWKAAC